jgi:hypothetical protein
LHGKGIHFEVLLEVLQATDTGEPAPNGKSTRRKKPPLADSDIESVFEWRHGNDTRRLEFQRSGVLGTFEMQGIPLGNMLKMDFHRTFIIAQRPFPIKRKISVLSWNPLISSDPGPVPSAIASSAVPTAAACLEAAGSVETGPSGVALVPDPGPVDHEMEGIP